MPLIIPFPAGPSRPITLDAAPRPGEGNAPDSFAAQLAKRRRFMAAAPPEARDDAAPGSGCRVVLVEGGPAMVPRAR